MMLGSKETPASLYMKQISDNPPHDQADQIYISQPYGEGFFSYFLFAKYI